MASGEQVTVWSSTSSVVVFTRLLTLSLQKKKKKNFLIKVACATFKHELKPLYNDRFALNSRSCVCFPLMQS
jgi:hypothetical protein